MAAKIKLQRIGKVRNAQYRIIVADARTRRSGRAIENLGIYQPKEEPSVIQIDSERAQYWIGVGAQPTEPVLALLKITGDWQKAKGLPGAEGTLKVAEEKPSKLGSSTVVWARLTTAHPVRLVLQSGQRPRERREPRQVAEWLEEKVARPA